VRRGGSALVCIFLLKLFPDLFQEGKWHLPTIAFVSYHQKGCKRRACQCLTPSEAATNESHRATSRLTEATVYKIIEGVTIASERELAVVCGTLFKTLNCHRAEVACV